MRIPFAVQSYQSRALPVSAQRLVNMYLEQPPPNTSDQQPVYSAPGLKPFSTLVGNIRGIHRMAGVLYAVAQNNLYSVDSAGTGTLIGPIAGAGRVGMADNGTQLVIVANPNGYVYNRTLGGISPITDPDWPGATSVTYQDGYFIFTRPDSGQFFLSALFDGLDYDALDFATAEGSPDNALMVLSDHRELWVFGEDSTEVYFNSGGSFPFERQTYIEQGIGASTGATKLDNSIIMYGDDGIIYRFQNFVPVRISNHNVEEAIRGYVNKEAVSVFSYVLDGHKCVVFAWDEGAWVIDLTTGLWHERESKDDQKRDLGRWRVCCGTRAYGKNLVGDFQNGKLYELDLDTGNEDGVEMVCRATSPKIGDSVKTVFQGSLEMVMETGVGLTSGQGSNPQIMLRWSDDGGKTWGNEHWRTFGKIGDYSNRVRWNRLGSFESRVYEVAISDSVKRVIISADAE